jgi:hypothetical protein
MRQEPYAYLLQTCRSITLCFSFVAGIQELATLLPGVGVGCLLASFSSVVGIHELATWRKPPIVWTLLVGCSPVAGVGCVARVEFPDLLPTGYRRSNLAHFHFPTEWRVLKGLISEAVTVQQSLAAMLLCEMTEQVA